MAGLLVSSDKGHARPNREFRGGDPWRTRMYRVVRPISTTPPVEISSRASIRARSIDFSFDTLARTFENFDDRCEVQCVSLCSFIVTLDRRYLSIFSMKEDYLQYETCEFREILRKKNFQIFDVKV